MKNKLLLSTVVVKKSELLESSVDDETILLSISNSKYYGLDPVAGRIWSLLEEKISIDDIIKVLMIEYDVTRKDCEKDVISFVNSLADEKLIDITDG